MMEGRSGCAKCSETTRILKVEKTRASRAIQCLQLYKQLLLNYDTKHLNISRSQLESVVKKSAEENNALRQRLSLFIDSSNQLLAKQVDTSAKVSDLERKLSEAENQSVLLEFHNKQLSEYFSINEDNRDKFIDKIRKLARIVLKYDPENKEAAKALKMKFNFGSDYVQINRKVAQNYIVTKKEKLEDGEAVPGDDSVRRKTEQPPAPNTPPPSGETSPLSVEEVECGIINEDSILSVSSDASSKGNNDEGTAERSVRSVRNYDGAISERSDGSVENLLRVGNRSERPVDSVKGGRTSMCSRLDLEFFSDSDLDSSLSSEDEYAPSDRADSPCAVLTEEDLCSTAGSPRRAPPADSSKSDPSIQSFDISSCQNSVNADLPNDRITDVLSQSKVSNSENYSKSILEKLTNPDQSHVTCSQSIFDPTSSSVTFREDKKHLERDEIKRPVASEVGRNSVETKEQQSEKSSNSKLAGENVNSGKSSQVVNNPLENSEQDIRNSCDQLQVVSDQSLFEDNVESCKRSEGKQSPPVPMSESEGSLVMKIHEDRELNTSMCLESSEEQNSIPESPASSVGGFRSECGSKHLGGESGERKLKHEVRSPANSCCGWGYSKQQNSSMLSSQFSRCCPSQPILIKTAGKVDLRLKVTNSGDGINIEVVQPDEEGANIVTSQDAGGCRRKGLTLTISSGVLDTPGCFPPDPSLPKGYSIFETHRGSCFGKTKAEDLASDRRGLWYFTDSLLENRVQLSKFSVGSFLAASSSENVRSRTFTENSWSYSETKFCDTFQKLTLRCDTSDGVVPERATKEQVGSQLFSQCTFHNRLATSSSHPLKMARLFGKSYEKEVHFEKNAYSIFSQNCISPVFDKTVKSQFSILQKRSENQNFPAQKANNILNKKQIMNNGAFCSYRNLTSFHCMDPLFPEPEGGRNFVNSSSGGCCSVLQKARLKSSSLTCVANERTGRKSSPGGGSVIDKEAPSTDFRPPSSPQERASPERRESCRLLVSPSTSKSPPGDTSKKSSAESQTSSLLARASPDNSPEKRESCRLLASPSTFNRHPVDTSKKSPAELQTSSPLFRPNTSFKERPGDTGKTSYAEPQTNSPLVRASPDCSPERRESCRFLDSPNIFKGYPGDTTKKNSTEPQTSSPLPRTSPVPSPERMESCRLLASPNTTFKRHPGDTSKKSPAELQTSSPLASPNTSFNGRLGDTGTKSSREPQTSSPTPGASPDSSPERRESCRLLSSPSIFDHPGDTGKKIYAQPQTSSPLGRVSPYSSPERMESSRLLASPSTSFKRHPGDTSKSTTELQTCSPPCRNSPDSSPAGRQLARSFNRFSFPLLTDSGRISDKTEKESNLVARSPKSRESASMEREVECGAGDVSSALILPNKVGPPDSSLDAPCPISNIEASISLLERPRTVAHSKRLGNTGGGEKRGRSEEAAARKESIVQETQPGSDNSSGIRTLSKEPPSIEPPSKEPTSREPTSIEPPSREPPSREPTSREPTSIEPPSKEPTSIEPTSVEPTSIELPSKEPTSVEPPSREPTSIEPPSIEPPSKEPPSNEPTSREPTSKEPTSVEPPSSEPTSSEPTSSEPTSIEPSSNEPTSVEPPSREPSSIDPPSREPSSIQVEGQILSPLRPLSSRVLRSSSTSTSKLTGKSERKKCAKDRAVALSEDEDGFAVPATAGKRRTDCEGEVERICGSYLMEEPLVSPLKATPKKRTTGEGGEDSCSKTNSTAPDSEEDIQAAEVTLLKIFQEYEYPACLSPLPVSMDESFCISSGSHVGIKGRKKRKNSAHKDTVSNRVKKRKLRSEDDDGEKEGVLSIKETVQSIEISTEDENKNRNSTSTMSVMSSCENKRDSSSSVKSVERSGENKSYNSSSVVSEMSSCENERDSSSSVKSVERTGENKSYNSSSVVSEMSSCENKRDSSSSVVSEMSSCENKSYNSSSVVSEISCENKNVSSSSVISGKSWGKNIKDRSSSALSEMSSSDDEGFSCGRNLNIHDTDESNGNETSIAQNEGENQSEDNSELAEVKSHENFGIIGENDSKHDGVHLYVIDMLDRTEKKDVTLKNVAEESFEVIDFNSPDSKSEDVGAEDLQLASGDEEDIGLFTNLRESSVDELSLSVPEETCEEAAGESTAETSKQDIDAQLRVRKSANRKQYGRKGRTGYKAKTEVASDGRSDDMRKHLQASQDVLRTEEDSRNNLGSEDSVCHEDREGNGNMGEGTCESVSEKHSCDSIRDSDGYLKENTYYNSEAEVVSRTGNLHVKREKKDSRTTNPCTTANSVEETPETTDENDELQIWEEEEKEFNIGDLSDPDECGELLSIVTDTEISEGESQSVTEDHNIDYTASLGSSSKYCDDTGLVSSEVSCSETSAAAAAGVSEDPEKVTPRFYLDRSVVSCDQVTSTPPSKSLNFYTEAAQSENVLENSKLTSESVKLEPIVSNSCFRESASAVKETRPIGISDHNGADEGVSGDEETSTGGEESSRRYEASLCTKPFHVVQHTAQSCTSDRLFRKRKNSDPHTSKQSNYKKLKMDNYIECADQNSFIVALQQFSKEVHSETFALPGSTEKMDISRIKKKVSNLLQSTASDICPKLMLTVQELLEIPETNAILLTRSCIEVVYSQKTSGGGESGGGGSAQERLPRDLRLLFMLITSYLSRTSTGPISSSPQLDHVLSTFEENISSFQDKSLTIQNLCRMVWLYTVICRLYWLDSRVRKTIYDIIYTRNMKAYPMVLRVLQSWPEILPRCHRAKDCLLSQTVVLLLQSGSRKYALDTKAMSSFCMGPLWNLLERRYGYARDLARKDTLTQHVLENIQNKVGSESLVLLCKCEGWPWTKQLIDRQLVPRLRSWLDARLDDATAASIAVALGRILRGVSVTEASSTVRNTLELLQTILLSSVDAEFCEQIAEAISLLRRHNLVLCALIFIQWTPRAGFLTPNTLLHIRKVLAVKCLFHWKNFYLKYHSNEAKS